jgi:hypothetical protein
MTGAGGRWLNLCALARGTQSRSKNLLPAVWRLVSMSLPTLTALTEDLGCLLTVLRDRRSSLERLLVFERYSLRYHVCACVRFYDNAAR